jgi:poly(hydroxyalkanoate) depolymerase family esterase
MDEQVAFGANPGNLGMFSCVPPRLAKSSPLVVALHGCQQTARDFDLATGWSELGQEHGFAVLFPEQKCGNNSQNCFNWFIEKHISREDGEIASIRIMIEKMLRDHELDRDRVYVTGLSAGGAMACALLAAYPDLFAAGTIIAGLPYGAAVALLARVGKSGAPGITRAKEMAECFHLARKPRWRGRARQCLGLGSAMARYTSSRRSRRGVGRGRRSDADIVARWRWNYCR